MLNPTKDIILLKEISKYFNWKSPSNFELKFEILLFDIDNFWHVIGIVSIWDIKLLSKIYSKAKF